MTMAVHSLGALNLIYTTSAASTYFVAQMAGDIDWNEEEEYVPLRSSSGARLSYSLEKEGEIQLEIMCLGDTFDLAKAARAAIKAELDAAKAGSLKTYVERATVETTARTYRIVGGKFREVSALTGRGPQFGFAGRSVANAIANLKLSRN